MPTPRNPKAKVFRGWAVYGPRGGILETTIDKRKISAQECASCVTGELWAELECKGYTCRPVIVTAAGPTAGGK